MKILLSVDDDPAMAHVLGSLDWSIELSQWTEILVVHVIPQNPLFLVGADAPRARRGQSLMERVGEQLSHLPVRVTRVLAKGDPAQEIVRMADSTCAELIVLGAWGERHDFLMGSVSQRVVSLAPTDVLVVRGGDGRPPAAERGGNFRALLAVDGSLECEAGIDAFCRKLRARSASIRVVHVLEAIPTLWDANRPARTFVEQLNAKATEVLAWARGALERRGFQAECEWRRGDPAAQILEAARETESDVIVLGSRGHSAIREMVLGGITHQLLRHAPCNVLCARGWAPQSSALSRRWLSEAWEPGAGMA
jgi:nucleotide-binding universal stress UspA family protein